MSDLRAIDPSPLRARYSGPTAAAGDRPELQWLKIARLRIDPGYQRDIGERGQRNIVAIATAFSWSKFTPVVVATIKGNLFAIVDGQHRTTAAALRGFESVPCVIISADEAAQADAFVAINANVTAMSPLQIHAARLAAGDKKAAELVEACSEADVTICRYPVPASKMKPGDTLAAAMLLSALERHGREVLVSALCCITRTRRGNVGLIRKQIVEALCTILAASPERMADRKALIFAMQSFDFAAQFNAARARSIETGEKVYDILVSAIGSHLEGKSARAAAVPPAPAQSTAPARAPAVKPAQAAAKPAVKAPEAPPPKPAKQEPAQPKPLQVGGLSIGRDEIIHNGQRLKVAPREALLVQVLAKAKPNCIGDEFLIGKLWNVRPPSAPLMLDQLVIGLEPLKAIGLEVRTHKGVGRQLVELSE